MDYITKFKARLDDLNRNLDASDFRVCSNISSDLIRASEFMDYPEGVFIGEYFESLFDNLTSLINRYKVDKDEIELIKSEIVELVKLTKEVGPTADSNVKSRLYDMLVKVRYMTTEFQVRQFREGKRKRPRPPERFASPEEILE